MMLPADKRPPGIPCPHCGSQRSSVEDSRQKGLTVRRRRFCAGCRQNFFTREFPELLMPDHPDLDRLFAEAAA